MKFKSNEPAPQHFKEVNFTYTAPKGMEDNCGDLPCFRADGIAISCWSFPIWDRLRFLFTGRMWFFCLMNGHPPITLMTKKPKIPTKDVA